MPIREEVFTGPVFLTGGGRAICPPRADYPPPGHPNLYQFNWEGGRILPEYSLLWIESGAGQWQTHEGSHPIGAQEVGQVFSGQWHRYRPDKKTGWTECWLQFNGPLVHELEERGVISRNRPVRSPADPRRFARQFLDLLQDIASPDFVNDTAQGLKVLGLLGLLESPEEIRGLNPLGLVEKARQHIWSYSHRPLDVPEIAESLGVGRRTLERAFGKKGGTGVLEEIITCRLNRAERLLRETQLPVQQIVNLAGFGTAEQMRLNFQNKHGVSPSGYRKLFWGSGKRKTGDGGAPGGMRGSGKQVF